MAVDGRTLRRRYVLVLLVLTAITLMTLDQRRDDSGPLGFLGSAVHEIVGPVQRLANAVFSPIGDWVDGVTSAGSLKDENADLERRLSESEALVQRAEDAIEENKRLNELLGLEFLEGIDRITARVISPPVGNFEETVVVDKGSNDGVRVGLPVVAVGGLYGRIVEVSPSESKILLLTDKRFSVSVRSARERLVGIASGQGSETLALEFVEGVTQDEEPVVVVGDAIVTSGLDPSRYPGGIPVGEIVEIVDDPTAPDRSAEVDPVVRFGAVELVQILDWDPNRDPEPESAATDDTTSTSTSTGPATTGEGAPADDGGDGAPSDAGDDG